MELRRWARQPAAVASTLVLPVALASSVSLALGDPGGDTTVRFGVVDHDHGPAAEAFVEEALGHPAVDDVVEVVALDSEQVAARRLDDGDVDVVVVLPAGLSRSLVTMASPAGIDVWRRDRDPLAGDLAELVVDQFAVRAHADAVALQQTGALPTSPWPLEVVVTAPDGAPLDAAGHYGPAAGMFFVLVAMGFAAQRFVLDRRRGVVDRLAAGPFSPTAVLAGRGIAAAALGGLSLGVTAGAMQALFGRSWGPFPAVLALALAVVVAMGGVACLVAALARTPEQASTLAGAVAFVFALASGSFSPPGSIGTRPRLAELVPTTHALDAFALLATEHPSFAELMSPLAWLVAFGAASLAATALVARRWV